MSWTDRHNNPGYKNWLRVGIALLETRDGLADVTLRAAKELQAELVAKLGNSVDNCTCNPKKGKTCKDCELWRQELETYYTGDGSRIGWSNCTRSKLSKEPWEVAKLFMPKGQPTDNTGPEKSDPSALLNFLVFCNYCKKYFSKVEPLKKVIEVRNQAMHSKDLTFDHQTFNNHIDKLLRLMRDRNLASDPAAQKAFDEISKIKKEEFHLGAGKACMDAEVRVLTDVMEQHTRRLQLHQEELEDHGTRLDNLEQSIPPQEEILKTVETLLDIVNTNTDLQRFLKDQALELSTTVQQLQDRLGRAEGRLGTAEGDITDVKGAVSQLEETVAEQRETAAEHGARIEEVSADNTRLNEEISDVKSKIKRTDNNVEEVRQKLHQLAAPSASTRFSPVPVLGATETEPSLTDVFQKSVKKYYELKLLHFKPLIWNDNFTLTLSDIFTQLELVQTSTRKRRKGLTSLDDLFKPDVTGLSTPPRCILIEGEAGGGKTTFLSKEALDAVSQKTELGRRHDIVLLIRLREVRDGETIEEMVWDQCVPETTKGIDVKSTTEILQRNECRVLFLLDGYDELRPEARSDGQAIPKLLSGKLYPNSMIVITSRRSAGVQQYTRPDCHVHIMGFSPRYVAKYVKDYFITNPELAENFIRQYFIVLEKVGNPSVHLMVPKDQEPLCSLMQTPIFLMLLCLLWEEDQEMVSTGTMAGLYDNLLTCLVRKHCEREGVDMPTEGLPTEVAESLLQLGKLVLEALLRNETLLDLTEVKREKVNWELLLKLGVVALEFSSSKLHPRKQLNFSHKTMQEFLAGRYVAHALLNQDIVELLQLTSITKALELSNLLKFTCGCDSRAAQAVMEELSKLRGREFTHLGPEQFDLTVDQDMQKSCKTYERFASLCLTIFSERQEPEMVQCISQALPIVMLDSSLDSKEATALNYYIQHFQSANLPDRLILKIHGGPYNRDTVQYLQQCFTTSLPGLRLNLKLSGKFNSPGQTARLVSVLKNVPGLRALGLFNTHLTPSSLQPLVQGFSHMSQLKELDLSGNPDLDDAGMEFLQDGHLAVLRLGLVGMTAVGMSSLAPYMRHLVGLRELDICFNKIGDTGLESLTTILPIFTAMQVLDLKQTGMSPTGMRTLVPALCQLTRLIKLDISYNAIGDPGLECLAAILHHLTAIKMLLLRSVGISDGGISSLIKALPHLVQLQVLDVMGNNIGDLGIVSLVQTLCQPSSLDMEQNSPGDKSLTTNPHCDNTLQELYIAVNSEVTGAGLGRVAQLISALPALTRLDMSGYTPTPAQLPETVETLTLFNTPGYTPAHLRTTLSSLKPITRYTPTDLEQMELVTIKLTHLSDTAAMALAETLPRLPALEELYLDHIWIEPAGFRAVVQAAEEHPTLRRLECNRGLD